MRWTEKQLASTATGKKALGDEYADSKKVSTVIGIDSGVSTGFAVYDKQNGKFLQVKTIDFWQAYQAVQAYPPETTLVRVEVSKALNVWSKGKGKGSMDKLSTATKVGANVGGVRREAVLFAEGCEKLGYKVERVHPQGKVDAAYFNRVTGYDGRTSNHARDAGMLAFKG